MPRVLTNNTALATAVETSLGVAGTTYFAQEPNEIGKFGNEISVTARNPISKNRQKRKGAVTDADSGVEFEHDLTMSFLENLIEAFVMATGTNADVRFRNLTAVSGGYTIPAATASQGGKFQFNASGPISLVYARGYVNAANNGLRALTSDLATSGTTIPITGSTAETPPTNATVELTGIRATAGDLAWTLSGTTLTLVSGQHAVSGAAQINFTTLGWTVGQTIHIGGLTNANRGFGAGPIVSFGYARIRTIAAASVTFDKVSSTLITSDGTTTGAGGTNVAVDLLWGEFIRNVAVDNAAFLTRTYTVEAAWDDLATGPVDAYSYAKGNMCNELAFNLALADKATCSVGMVGTFTDAPVTVRKTGGSTPIEPIKTGAVSTTADILRLRVTAIDESGLTTDFKEATLTLNNGITGEKVLANLGPKFLNTGNFEVSLEAKVLFSERLVIDAINANTEVTMDMILRNTLDGGFVVDIPTLTLGDGSLELPVNESVNINLTGTAHQSSFFGTSVGVSLFPIMPTS